MPDSIKDRIRALFAPSATTGGVKGRLGNLTATIEKEIASSHSVLGSIESGLRADIDKLNSAALAEAARLHQLIHGEAVVATATEIKAP